MTVLLCHVYFLNTIVLEYISTLIVYKSVKLVLATLLWSFSVSLLLCLVCFLMLTWRVILTGYSCIINLYAYIHTHTYTHTHTRTHTHVHTHTHAHTYTHAHTCTHTCAHIQRCKHTQHIHVHQRRIHGSRKLPKLKTLLHCVMYKFHLGGVDSPNENMW